MDREFTRRHLPHWQPPGKAIFVTFRLFGSLPISVMQRIAEEKALLKCKPQVPTESLHERTLRESRRLFALTEQELNRELARSGAILWLQNPEIARLVEESIHYRHSRVYDLHRYTIMPNHVHLLFTPLPVGQVANLSPTSDSESTTRPVAPQIHQADSDSPSRQVGNLSYEETEYHSLSSIMQSLKRHTGLHANRLLGRTGPFWQDESFDHWVRDGAEHQRIVDYIDQNPVKACLCSSPNQWPWGSASK